MKPRKFYGLRRPKLRQSWNKYNLFNIQRFMDPHVGSGDSRTFFQQKWRAKGMMRNYHGEHVVERKWVRMFSRRLLGVVDMDTKYMAEHDGSELAAGRGSGKDDPPNWDELNVGRPRTTPYMMMTFAPMERRLDIAVFRAMFASSTRQARQFCVHGNVKVNGKVMPYPAYRLNPGDMFQVDPERVLLATGAPKNDRNKVRWRNRERKPRVGESSVNASKATEGAETPAEGEEEEASEAKEAEAEAPEQDPDTTDKPEAAPVDLKPTREYILELASRAKDILKEQDVGALQKQRLRRFVVKMRRMVSQTGRPDATPAQIAEELAAQVGGLALGGTSGPAPSPSGPASSAPSLFGDASLASLSKHELRKLEQRVAEQMREEEENPWDPSKPYKTPWRPREFMSPFAFIPKYLEVNQNICAAVYLRHPVAKVGRAEVPTPFPENVNQLAFNWYLRRR
ncbi:alpha-L RNA-binding motif-containing protein [Annulohypoxylon bovei var. microspora]|nr:alpha-L RNA-binding motif-containing protein [Annulohypoxylon bovei var. microspora]